MSTVISSGDKYISKIHKNIIDWSNRNPWAIIIFLIILALGLLYFFVRKKDGERALYTSPEDEEKLQSELRFFILGFTLALAFGVPVGLWGIYFFADKFTFLSFLRLLALGTAIFIAIVIIWFRKWLFRLFRIPGKQGLTDFFKNVKILLEAIHSGNIESAKDETTKIIKIALSKYGWWALVAWGMAMIFGLVITFGNLLDSALSWKGNKLVANQNELMKKQNNFLKKQIKQDANNAVDIQVTKYFEMLFGKERKKFWVAVAYFKNFSSGNSEEERKLRLSVYKRIATLLLTVEGKATCRALELTYHVANRKNVADFLRGFRLFSEFGATDKKRKFYHINQIICPQNESVNLKYINFKSTHFSFDFFKASLRGSNFRKANFQGTNFAHADLRNSKFSMANLKDANLTAANLQDAELMNAKLQKADLEEADLRKTNFFMANLQGTILSSAKLQGANFAKSIFMDANLKGANLRKANFQKADLRRVNLQGTDLTRTNFWSAKLQEADFRKANFQDTTFTSADLQKANFTNTDLRKTNLVRADLRKAKLMGVDLTRVNLRNAKLQGAELGKAKLQSANFEGANLQNVDLSKTDLQKAKLFGAKLRNVNLSGTKLDYVDLREADLSNANLQNVDFMSTDLYNTKFYKANISQSLFKSSQIRKLGRIPAFKKARILSLPLFKAIYCYKWYSFAKRKNLKDKQKNSIRPFYCPRNFKGLISAIELKNIKSKLLFTPK